jgi:hypothetical protein
MEKNAHLNLRGGDAEVCAPQHNLPATVGTVVGALCAGSWRRGGGGGGGRALTAIDGISL